MNASPSLNLAALLNSAIDLGLEIVEAPIGAGFLVVAGAANSVTEWVNETSAMVTSAGPGRLTAARPVVG